MRLGEQLKKFRESQGWTQDEMALLLGTTQANYSKIEAGLAYKNATERAIERIIKHLEEISRKLDGEEAA